MKENKAIYPVEAWDITEEEFRMEHVYRNETTLFGHPTVISEREELLRKVIHFPRTKGWKGILSMGFMKARRFATENGTMVFRRRARRF